ncbi:MAG: VapC toxin family PIN domain ribonuclease [Limisphaerales bacterium]
MVLVDSSVWIEAARRDGDLAVKVGLESLLEAYEVLLCGPVWLEVLGGARPADRTRWQRGFGALPFRETPDGIWQSATENSWRLRDQGQTVPWNDVVIGTLSIRWGHRIYACDRHFEVLRDLLGVRLYSPGPGGGFAPDSGE